MQYLTIKQLRSKLNRSTNSIYMLIKDGQLPKPVKLGGENIWREDTIDNALFAMASAQGAGWSAPVSFEGARA